MFFLFTSHMPYRRRKAMLTAPIPPCLWHTEMPVPPVTVGICLLMDRVKRMRVERWRQRQGGRERRGRGGDTEWRWHEMANTCVTVTVVVFYRGGLTTMLRAQEGSMSRWFGGISVSPSPCFLLPRPNGIRQLAIGTQHHGKMPSPFSFFLVLLPMCACRLVFVANMRRGSCYIP